MTGTNSITILSNANVIDVVTGHVMPDQTIVIEGGTIKEISDGSPQSASANLIDLHGAFLMPGLIDCHVHVTAYANDFGQLSRSSPSYVAAQAAVEMRRMLMRGFTSVRDVGGADFGLALAVEEGLFDGPRLFYGGKALSQTGGHGDMRTPGTDAIDGAYSQPGLGVICDGVSAVRKAAREELRRGAHHVKIMGGGGAASPTDRLDSDQFSEEEIAAIVEEAQMANRYTVVHAYSPRTIERATRLGVRSVEHGNFLDEETALLMKRRGAYLVPTLTAYHSTARYGAELGITKSTLDKIDALVSPGLEAVQIAYRAGIPMAYGTDLVGHYLQQFQLSEFEIRKDVLPTLEIIRAATLNGASLLQREKTLGQVKVGFDADLIALAANPLDDIGVLAAPDKMLKLIIKQGQVHKSSFT